MSDSIPVEWLRNIGWEVDELLRLPGTRDRFLAMHEAWRVEVDRQLQATKEWNQRRHDYFTRDVASSPLLQINHHLIRATETELGDLLTGRARVDYRLMDRYRAVEARPPGECHQFITYHWDDSPYQWIGGWCPPELWPEAEPKVHEVLRFTHAAQTYDLGADPSHPLDLAEKYVLCAAIHDDACHGAEPILPDAPCSDVPSFERKVGFFVLRSDVRRLEDCDRPAVEAFLRDVGEDLQGGKASHSADFTFVNWYGTQYTFALGVQSSAVRALWDEWRKSGLGLHQDTIRNAVDAERNSFRMGTAFRNHPAFGVMIQRCGDGRYKLAPPTVTPAPKKEKDARITAKSPRKRA